MTWSVHSRRAEPIKRSTWPFCQGERNDVGRSRMPIARTRALNAARRDLAASLKNQCRASVRRLFCAVGAIASISQAWDNEPSLIESIVDGRSPKTNIGMKPTDSLHSFLRGNQTDKTDILRSALLDTINGSTGCIAGSQH